LNHSDNSIRTAQRSLRQQYQNRSTAGPDIKDDTGLGRWSGVSLEGPESKKLSIITAYRVCCSGSPQTSPIGSSFLREYEFFRERRYTSPNPRRLFLKDLQNAILALQDAGHSIIIMLDANSTMDDPFLMDFLAKCGLHDLHSRDPAPSTYIGSSNRRIRSGTLAYTDGPQSDHRSLYVDLSRNFIFPPSWNAITPTKSRDLHTGIPEMVQLYHNCMLEYYSQHRMVDCLQKIYEQRHSMDREKLRSALIKWDNDQGRAMELSERNLRRPQQKCAWSPTLRNAAILRRYWMLRLRQKLRNEDYTSSFLRWQQKVQHQDSDSTLPFSVQSIPLEQIRTSRNRVNQKFRHLQKQSVPLRLRTYQELMEYQDDRNPATQAKSHRKETIIQNTMANESTRGVFDNLRQVVRPIEQSCLSKVLVPSNSSLASITRSS
jgi:hypothetical protein